MCVVNLFFHRFFNDQNSYFRFWDRDARVPSVGNGARNLDFNYPCVLIGNSLQSGKNLYFLVFLNASQSFPVKHQIHNCSENLSKASSPVGIATRCDLDGPGINSRWR